MSMTTTPTQADETARRGPQPSDTLSSETLRWLAELPGDLRPRYLPIEFARITNELCRRWAVPGHCLGYLDRLLIDTRGNRRGFPFGAALELAHLKNYYETTLHPTTQTIWDEIVARAHA